MNPLTLWILQVLILATGIYFFLRFLRTTRGSGLMRGLIVTVLVVVIGLLSLVQLLGLEELDYLIKKIAGFVVVILAILFQPELRRGITRLGERSLAGKLLARRRKDTVNEVVQAASAMAARRVGALIAFEREYALDDYVDNAAKIDGEVGRLMLESIFHPGAALHDGAVVVRNDRVAAASCLFPLTENEAVSRTTGTRHRAALGLTEETDAVALIVSEETGKISVCRRGKMISDISPGRLEEVLRDNLGEESGEEPEVRGGARRLARNVFARDVPRKLTSVALAAGLLYFAHRDITEVVTHRVQIVKDAGEGTALPGVLAVRLPSDDIHMVEPKVGDWVELRISGTRGSIARRARLSGSLVLTQIDVMNQEFPLDQVDWTFVDDGSVADLSFAWAQDEGELLRLNRVGRKRINLEPRHLVIDTSQLDRRYTTILDDVEFSPAFVVVTGPEALIAELDTEALPFQLAPITFEPDDAVQWRETVGIAPALDDRSLTLQEPSSVTVEIPIVAVERDLGLVEKEIALVCLDPALAGELERWSLPPNGQNARFRIRSRGILPSVADDGSAEALEAALPVREYVRENLRVYVDIAGLSAGKGQAEVRWTGLDDWRDALGIQAAGFTDETSLDLELVGDAKILLVEREAPESDTDEDE